MAKRRTQVVRFSRDPYSNMVPGVLYDEEHADALLDWPRTERAVLDEFDQWRASNPDATVIDVCGLTRMRVPPDGDHDGGWRVEMTVLYEVSQP